MAGDWIKVENVTPDKPEVFKIATIMGIDPDAVVGKLFRIWIWADQQTTDGHAVGVTHLLIDKVCGAPGFAKAMSDSGWLMETENGLEFVNFGEHNGETAKQRALAARRKARQRQKSRTDDGNGHAVGVTHQGQERELEVEKRRDKTTTTTANGEVEIDDRGRFKIFGDWAPEEKTFPAVCFRAGVKPEFTRDQLGKYLNWHIDDGRNTFRSQHDWERLFCNWLKGDQSDGKGDQGNGNCRKGVGSGGSGGLSTAERIERANP